MDIESELYKQNPWWEGKFKEKSIPREIYLNEIFENIKNKEIIFLTGLRRIGKTTLLMQTINQLLTNQTKPEDILFIQLDSFNLLGFSVHQLIEEYRKIHKKSATDFFYLFLDEVTSRDNFEQELKSLYDNENLKIICSSSIATLMRDKKALLTGRTKTIEIMPLNFQEFLKFKGADIGKADKAKLESYFKDYLRIGGIPYFVLTEDRAYLNELVESIVYKDIIAYYKISGEKAVKELFVLLCQGVGKPMSYNKLAELLKISVDSVKRYVGYFEKAYLFYVVDRYSKSTNEKVTSPKKIYIGDVGIKNVITGFKDLGASYENLVFLKIKNKNPNYYLENSIEIDFITKDSLIETKYNQELNEKQLEVFNKIKLKNKIIANGYKFFLE
ncbi:ATP-binding protein [Candidatus Woesearchaeota archaeon]|nr:ATP-binding protein [Candidatus Woesearchaeota archaeon]